ncbi:MAG: 6,7-dimethyl-8-ribityllumazine synthase [Bacteroidales bacterium]|nr:6,7-dimethyl-8-ribityllumazine synthase [Bacteroidales bacterium]
MATALKNLSDYDPESIPAASGMRFAIVVSEWNQEITFALMRGAMDTLIRHGANPNHIKVDFVPGSFELTAGARMVAEAGTYDAVICIGCIIRGDTPHFDYICQGVTMGITGLNVRYDIPFVFGVLTTENQQQALDRAGGKHGNKGDEAAVTAIKMVALKRRSFGRS